MYVPEEWCQLVENCRRKNPFKVTRMETKDLVSTSTLRENIVYRKVNTMKEKVKWLKIRYLMRSDIGIAILIVSLSALTLISLSYSNTHTHALNSFTLFHTHTTLSHTHILLSHTHSLLSFYHRHHWLFNVDFLKFVTGTAITPWNSGKSWT